MKAIKKTISLCLAAIVVCVCGVTAFASETIYTPEILGGLEDQDGILLADDVYFGGNVALPQSAQSLFSMTADQVYNLLTTYGTSKHFTGGVMDAYSGEGLLVSGTVTSSLGSGSIKVGACYYDSYNDKFVSAAYSYFPSGSSDYFWASKVGHFSNSITYYGHITNNLGSGYVHGTLSFSVATSPYA